MMGKISDNDFRCDFGSGAQLRVGLQSAHVVIEVKHSTADDARKSSIAMTPASLRDLGMRLVALAGVYEREKV